MSEEPETKELVFAATKEHLRFGEFCDACRKYRYIGSFLETTLEVLEGKGCLGTSKASFCSCN